MFRTWHVFCAALRGQQDPPIQFFSGKVVRRRQVLVANGLQPSTVAMAFNLVAMASNLVARWRRDSRNTSSPITMLIATCLQVSWCIENLKPTDLSEWFSLERRLK